MRLIRCCSSSSLAFGVLGHVTTIDPEYPRRLQVSRTAKRNSSPAACSCPSFSQPPTPLRVVTGSRVGEADRVRRDRRERPGRGGRERDNGTPRKTALRGPRTCVTMSHLDLRSLRPWPGVGRAGVPTLSPALTPGQRRRRRRLDRWLSVNIPGTIAESTEDDYNDIVRLHLRPALGDKRLTSLTVAELDKLWNAKREAGYSANSVRIMRTVLRRTLGQAEREGIVARNVAAL